MYSMQKGIAMTQKTFKWHEAKSRNSDPITSHNAAESVNKRGLSYQFIEVLRALKDNNGISAKDLGRKMAYFGHERYEWPRKRMSILVDKGYVRRMTPDSGKSMLCFITDMGREKLDK